MIACFGGNWSAVRELLDMGANPFYKNSDGWSPVELAKVQLDLDRKKGSKGTSLDSDSDCKINKAALFRQFERTDLENLMGKKQKSPCPSEISARLEGRMKTEL